MAVLVLSGPSSASALLQKHVWSYQNTFLPLHNMWLILYQLAAETSWTCLDMCSEVVPVAWSVVSCPQNQLKIYFIYLNQHFWSIQVVGCNTLVLVHCRSWRVEIEHTHKVYMLCFALTTAVRLWSERSCGAADWSTCTITYLCWRLADWNPNTDSSSIRILTNS